MNRIIFFSGGKSSFSVADYVKEHYPDDNIVLYFTDTLWENADLYRFINEASDKLQLPLLTHSAGINPLQLMYKEKVVFNSRIGSCSKVLKMKVSADFIKKGKIPPVEKWRNKQFLKDENFTDGAVLYFGIGFEEMHRQDAIVRNWQPYQVEMPLIDNIIDNNEILRKYDIRQPELYDLGFSHNNCNGRCVKAGQGHFKNLKEKMPDVFQKTLEQEHHMMLYVSSYHFLKRIVKETEDEMERDFCLDEMQRLDEVYKDYFDGKVDKPGTYILPSLYTKKYSFMKKSKKPYQLKDLKIDMQRDGDQLDVFDIGGCGCFIDFS